MSEYHIGQIFTDSYPPEAADFCNESQNSDNPCFIREIEPENGRPRYQIMSNDPISDEEILKLEISKRQMYLSETDWYVYRAMDTGVEMPAEIKAKRQSAREEISRLREELESKDKNNEK